MTFTVTRIRKEDTGEQDRYGKPVYADVRTDHQARAFAPVITDDVSGTDNVTSTDGGTLYFRAPNTPDGLPGDRWEVRGSTYEAEGRDALWIHTDGTVRGSVIVLRRTEYSDG